MLRSFLLVSSNSAPGGLLHHTRADPQPGPLAPLEDGPQHQGGVQ